MADRPGEPPFDSDERGLLLGWLDFHRAALAAKCEDLSDEQLIEPSAPPSNLTLLGLVRHLGEMERAYLHAPLSGEPRALRYSTDEDPEGDFEGLTTDDVAPSLAAWHEDVARSDQLLRGYLDVDVHPPGRKMAVRWLLSKVTGEYARHNGHADLLRERIDGATGE